MTEVEKQTKLIAELEAKLRNVELKLVSTRNTKADLHLRREGLHLRIADGDDGARKELRRLDDERQHVIEDDEAFSAATTTTTTKLAQAKKALALATDQAAIDQLENQMSNFAVLDGELQLALGQVATKSAALIGAIDGVGQKLAQRNEREWGRFGEGLKAQVRRAIFLSFESIGKGAAPRSTFSEACATDLRRAIAELRFAATGRRMTPQRGERLYRVGTNIGGLRDIDAHDGDLIALAPDDSETLRLLRDKSITLADESHDIELEGAPVSA